MKITGSDLISKQQCIDVKLVGDRELNATVLTNYDINTDGFTIDIVSVFDEDDKEVEISDKLQEEIKDHVQRQEF